MRRNKINPVSNSCQMHGNNGVSHTLRRRPNWVRGNTTDAREMANVWKILSINRKLFIDQTGHEQKYKPHSAADLRKTSIPPMCSQKEKKRWMPNCHWSVKRMDFSDDAAWWPVSTCRENSITVAWQCCLSHSFTSRECGAVMRPLASHLSVLPVCLECKLESLY